MRRLYHLGLPLENVTRWCVWGAVEGGYYKEALQRVSGSGFYLFQNLAINFLTLSKSF